MIDIVRVALNHQDGTAALTVTGDIEEIRELARTLTVEDRPAECCCAGCIGMGPCDDDLGKSDESADDDCCDGSTGVPGVDCNCYWRMGTDP